MKSHRFFLFAALFSLALFAASCTKESLSEETILQPKETIYKSTAAVSPGEEGNIRFTDQNQSTPPESAEEGEVKFTDPNKSATPVGLDEDRQGKADPVKTDTPVGIEEPGDGPKPADLSEKRYMEAGRAFRPKSGGIVKAHSGKQSLAGQAAWNDDNVIADPVHPKNQVIQGEKSADGGQ